MNFVELLQSIPDEVWSAVVGSMLTLLGVMASNRSHRKSLAQQLDHDAIQKEKDRKIGLRKEAYLLAAGQLSKAAAYIGGLAQLNIAKVNIGAEFKGLFAAASQVSLIAENNTSILVTRLTGHYAVLIADLALRMGPHSSLMGAIETHEKFYQQTQNEIERILEEKGRMIELDNIDEGIYETLDRRQQDYQNHANKLTVEIDELNKNLIAQRVKFNEYLFQQLEPLSKMQIQLMVALREELGVESNLEDFMRQLVENRTLVMNKIDEVHKHLTP